MGSQCPYLCICLWKSPSPLLRIISKELNRDPWTTGLFFENSGHCLLIEVPPQTSWGVDTMIASVLAMVETGIQSMSVVWVRTQWLTPVKTAAFWECPSNYVCSSVAPEDPYLFRRMFSQKLASIWLWTWSIAFLLWFSHKQAGILRVDHSESTSVTTTGDVHGGH